MFKAGRNMVIFEAYRAHCDCRGESKIEGHSGVAGSNFPVGLSQGEPRGGEVMRSSSNPGETGANRRKVIHTSLDAVPRHLRSPCSSHPLSPHPNLCMENGSFIFSVPHCHRL